MRAKEKQTKTHQPIWSWSWSAIFFIFRSSLSFRSYGFLSLFSRLDCRGAITDSSLLSFRSWLWGRRKVLMCSQFWHIDDALSCSWHCLLWWLNKGQKLSELLASKVLGITSKERMCCIGFVVGLGCFWTWTLLFSRKMGWYRLSWKSVRCQKKKKESVIQSSSVGIAWRDWRGREASYTFFLFPSIHWTLRMLVSFANKRIIKLQNENRE